MRLVRLTRNEIGTHSGEIKELLSDVYILNFLISIQEAKSIVEEKYLEIQKYNEDGSAIILGIVENEELIAFCWLYKYAIFNENRLHINQLAVRQEYRGRGLGLRLLKEVEIIGGELNITSIDLQVFESNKIANKLYESNGYKTEKRIMRKVLRVD